MPTPESPILPACEHRRVQVVARQQGEQFFECLDCHKILDSDDLGGGEAQPEAQPDDEEAEATV